METKKLGFGFMRLPVENNDMAKVDIETTKSMVDTFLERGFTYFDTAYMYHSGNSENAIREALVKRHDRNSYTLTTKLPVVFLKNKDERAVRIRFVRIVLFVVLRDILILW